MRLDKNSLVGGKLIASLDDLVPVRDEVTAHKNDNTRHVTTSDRTNWDGKETPTGAQTKVNTHANDSVKHISAAERSAWNGKAEGTHSHTIAQITSLQATLDGKAASSHTHAISQITDLQTTLDAKETPSGAQAKVNSHAGDSTAHITAAERTAWNGKAAGSHSHAISDITSLQTTLDGKAPTSHTHTIAQITSLQTTLDAKETPSGAQTKVNTHANDAVAHITAAERTAWNGKAAGTHTHTISQITSLQSELDAKETPAGAQTKATAALNSAKSYSDSLNTVKIKDTRAVNSPPSFYQTTEIQYEFKQLATLGITGVSGTYCTLMSDGRWSGSSGGQVTQIAYVDDNTLLMRTSTSTTAWGSWASIETTVGSQAKVNTHAGDSVAHITAAERTAWNAKETTTGAQTKATKALTDAKAYTDTKVFTTNSYQYVLSATANNQVNFTIPLLSYSPTTDTIIVMQNGMGLSNTDYTLVKNASNYHYIALKDGVAVGTQIFVLLFKNISPG